MRFFIILICLLGTVVAPAFGTAVDENTVFFAAEDPEGDDYGPGTYVYPRNKAFAPYEGLFDLLRFQVSGNDNELYFDVSIKTVTNPWAAPEGFIHPLIHIYVVTGRPGSDKPLGNGGAAVRFHPRYPWEYALLGIGWESSGLYFRDAEGNLKKCNIQARLLEDSSTIRLTVPRKYMGKPEKNWGYYVLIGSYDGFGPGFFRDITKNPGDWIFGGGLEETGEPRIIDMLAPASGKYAQEKQLSYPPKEGETVVLYPVGPRSGSDINWTLWITLAVVGLIGTIVFFRVPNIFGFWYKRKIEKSKN